MNDPVVVERGHGKTEPGGGHRQCTARALPRGRLPALGSSGWTRVPFPQRPLEAAAYLSKENQAVVGDNPEREEKSTNLIKKKSISVIAKPPRKPRSAVLRHQGSSDALDAGAVAACRFRALWHPGCLPQAPTPRFDLSQQLGNHGKSGARERRVQRRRVVTGTERTTALCWARHGPCLLPPPKKLLQRRSSPIKEVLRPMRCAWSRSATETRPSTAFGW
jgi:hypothetical protein